MRCAAFRHTRLQKDSICSFPELHAHSWVCFRDGGGLLNHAVDGPEVIDDGSSWRWTAVALLPIILCLPVDHVACRPLGELHLPRFLALTDVFYNTCNYMHVDTHILLIVFRYNTSCTIELKSRATHTRYGSGTRGVGLITALRAGQLTGGLPWRLLALHWTQDRPRSWLIDSKPVDITGTSMTSDLVHRPYQSLVRGTNIILSTNLGFICINGFCQGFTVHFGDVTLWKNHSPSPLHLDCHRGL